MKESETELELVIDKIEESEFGLLTPQAWSSSGSLPPSSNRRLLQTQAQVNEVVDIMRVNVDKVLDRDQKLSELDNRADALQAGASQFETSAAKLKRKYWWRNCKMMIVIGVVCALLFIILIICEPFYHFQLKILGVSSDACSILGIFESNLILPYDLLESKA
ncbi:vesicle-associated membrane protein 3-like [Gastrophryne carolinensis]